MCRDVGGQIAGNERDLLRASAVRKRETKLGAVRRAGPSEMKKTTKKRSDPARPEQRAPATAKRRASARVEPRDSAPKPRAEERGRARPWRALAVGVGLALATALVASVFDQDSDVQGRIAGASTPAPPEPPAPADAVALLDGLAVGDQASDFKVVSLSVPSDAHMARSVAVRLERRDGIAFTVWVTAAGAYPWLPARTSAKYAFFYSLPDPEGTALGEDDINGVLDAITARVARTEDRVARPGVL
jgi:hypothetical protein